MIAALLGSGSALRRASCGLLLAAALLGPGALVRAQEAPGDDRRYSEDVLERERALSSEIMSPFCPGRTLVSCPSPRAHSVREELKQYLAQGVSEAELRRTVQAQFGEVTNSTPSSPIGKVLPIVVLVIGAGVLAVAMFRFREQAGAGSSEAPTLSNAASRELEAELDRELKARGL
jgi:cytochrome c-type biogenesis protein CcmH/NrfF